MYFVTLLVLLLLTTFVPLVLAQPLVFKSLLQVKTNKQLFTSPLVFPCITSLSGQCALVTSTDKTVRVIEIRSGEATATTITEVQQQQPKWIRTLSAGVRSQPVLVAANNRNMAVFATEAGVVMALDLESGATVWEHGEKLGRSFGFSPLTVQVVSGQRQLTVLWFGFRNADITAYDAATGKVLVTIAKSDGVWAAPSISADKKRLYFALTASTSVGCVELPDDSSLLAAAAADAAGSSSAIVIDQKKWVFDIIPHATHWKQRSPFWIWPSPVELCTNAAMTTVSGRSSEEEDKSKKCLVVFGSVDGSLRAVSATTGKLVWDYAWDKRLCTSAASCSAAAGGGISQSVVQVDSKWFLAMSNSGQLRRLRIDDPIQDGGAAYSTETRESVNAPFLHVVPTSSAAAAFVLIFTASGRIVAVDVAQGAMLVNPLPGGTLIPRSCNPVSASLSSASASQRTLFGSIGCKDGSAVVLQVQLPSEPSEAATAAAAAVGTASNVASDSASLFSKVKNVRSVDDSNGLSFTAISIVLILLVILVASWVRCWKLASVMGASTKFP